MKYEILPRSDYSGQLRPSSSAHFTSEEAQSGIGIDEGAFNYCSLKSRTSILECIQERTQSFHAEVIAMKTRKGV